MDCIGATRHETLLAADVRGVKDIRISLMRVTIGSNVSNAYSTLFAFSDEANYCKPVHDINNYDSNGIGVLLFITTSAGTFMT